MSKNYDETDMTNFFELIDKENDDETDMTNFFKLIDKVSKIDPKAGVYLGNVVNDINSRKRLNVVNSEFLMYAFMWDKTEQGKSFWRDIYNKLGENNEKE